MNNNYATAPAGRVEGPSAPDTISAYLNEAMHDLNMLNEHLDQLHIRLYGPTPKNDEIKGGGQLLGAMGIHELSRTLKNAASNALDRLNNVEQQL